MPIVAVDLYRAIPLLPWCRLLPASIDGRRRRELTAECNDGAEWKFLAEATMQGVILLLVVPVATILVRVCAYLALMKLILSTN